MPLSPDLECSILVLAAQKDQALGLLRILVKDDSVHDDATSVPWTITNKYYTASVQFILRELTGWSPIEEDLRKIPAIVFTWPTGQPYKEHVERLSHQLAHHEPEVVLAVRLAPSAAPAVADIEDVQDIDGYLSSLGFEFVDATDSDEVLTPNRHGIPGVPRIVDALSTIIWPSMTRKSVSHDSSCGLLSAIHQRSRDDQTDRKLEELARWLDEDVIDADSDDAESTSPDGDNTINIWSTAVTPGNVTPHAQSNFGSRSGTPKAGFDDDFSSFVSAPALSPSDGVIDTSAPQDPPQKQSHPRSWSPPLASLSFSSTFSFESAMSGSSTPENEGPDHQSFDYSYLTLPNTSLESYKSLGSVSDFDDPDTDVSSHERMGPCATEHRENEDEDEEQPTTAEIAETSRRIFGSVPLTASPTVDRSTVSLLRATLPSEDDHFEALMKECDEGAHPDLGRFDLQEMLSALQELKEEIAGMSDDKARRKAAARVALGFAYGLDVDCEQ
ncbi:hypothetical protein V8B97DRAFT_179148 [Scleroderma yunnanense]